MHRFRGRSDLRRRTLPAGAAGTLASLAGCESDGGGGGGGNGTDTENEGSANGGGENGTDGAATGTDGEGGTDDGSGTDDGGTATSSPVGELDLREANVTGVSVSPESGRTFRFDVTLFHDVRKSLHDFRSPSEISDF